MKHNLRTDSEAIALCDKHFEQVERLGLVEHTYISEAEYRAPGGK